MASVYDLKPKFQNLLRPLCGRLARAGVTANQVTLIAAAISIVEGAWIAATHGSVASLIALPVVLFVRMALNAIDGMLAREFNQKTRLGAVLNEIGDVVSDTALYLPFALIAGVNAILVALTVAVAIIAEMTGVVGIQIGTERRYDGPFGKSDRALFFGALAVLLATGIIVPSLWTDIAFLAAIALGLVTIYNRAQHALAASK